METPERPGTRDLDLVAELQDQLDWHWRTQARPRLEGLTDAEYRWEPLPGTWNVRPQHESSPVTATVRAGQGDWVIDFAFPEPQPAPVTSIAWRVAHLVVGVFGARVHGHFGGPEADYGTWPYAPTADEALEQLDAAYAAWLAGVRGLDEAALTRPVGEVEGPWADRSMLTLVLHIQREAIHHLAEIALLRDLHAHRDDADVSP